MEMEQVIMANFKNRNELDKHVLSLNIVDSSKYEIVGNKEDLRRLRLDESCTIYKIKVKQID